jgi:UDP-N-acetylglucosamine:LPS N-acetylglucosamine transferase
VRTVGAGRPGAATDRSAPVTATLPAHPAAGRAPRVLIVSGSVGAGHDGAARELAARLSRAGVEVDIRDFLDATPRWVSVLLREGYTNSVDHVPAAFQLLFRRIEHEGPIWRISLAVCARAERTLAAWLAGGSYDLVVSTFPLSSQILGNLRARGVCRVPVVTYLTDPAAHRFWVHPAVDRHLTVTTATAQRGSAAYGVPLEAGGPLVPARFGRPVSRPELARLRLELGVPADRPLALLVGGSLGVGDLLPSVDHVAAAGLVPLVLCGRNERLRHRLDGRPGVIALGWRDDVHVLLQLADVLVHNAGGLSFTEALVSGLPAVTYRPIPGHGRANAAALDACGLAPWAHTPAQLATALHAQLRRGRRPLASGDPAEQVLAMLAVAAAA